MSRISANLGKLLFLIFLVVGYNNCLVTDDFAQMFGRTHETEVGNPFSANLSSMKIVQSTCQILRSAHPEITDSQCQNGVLSTSFSENLGVPSEVLNPYWSLAGAEQAGAVRADAGALQSCLSAIQNLDPTSAPVKAAFNSGTFNPFILVAQMIPTDPSTCPAVYRNNSFGSPTPPPPPPPGIVILDFNDRPPQVTTWGDGVFRGLYGGIDFGFDPWYWEIAYNADTTSHIYPTDTTSASFSFSGGPKLLLSLTAFSAVAAGQLTISDDQGQTVTQYIPADRAMHAVLTGFAKPSNVVTFNFPIANSLALDDIIYWAPPLPQPIAFIQGRAGVSTQLLNSQNFMSNTTAGNTIVVLAEWNGLFNFQSITDSQGNTFNSAVGPTYVGPTGATEIQAQQIFYAVNIKGGPDMVNFSIGGNHLNLMSDIYIFEYSGIDSVSPVEFVAVQSGNGTIADSGGVSASGPGDLIFGGGFFLDTQTWPKVGFAVRNSLQGHFVGDLTATGAGQYHIMLTPTTANPWLAQAVSFKHR